MTANYILYSALCFAVTSKDGYTAKEISNFSYDTLTSSMEFPSNWKTSSSNVTATVFSILTLNTAKDVDKLLDAAEAVSS